MSTSRGPALLLACAMLASACGSTLQETGSVEVRAGGEELAVDQGSALGASGGPADPGGSSGSASLGGSSSTGGLSSSGSSGSASLGGSSSTGGPSSSGSSGSASLGGSSGTAAPSSSGSSDSASQGGSSSTGGGATAGGDTGSSSSGGQEATPTAPTAPSDPAAGEPVKIGVAIADAAALYAVFGVDSEYDPYALYEAFKEYFNERGGLLGRPIELYYEVMDVAEDGQQAGQRVCEAFTVDNKMDLIYAAGFGPQSMLSCFAEHDMAVFAPARWTTDDTPAVYPNFFSLDGVRLDRYAGSYIDLAVAAGLIGEGDRLGVLYEDCPWGQRVYEGVSKPTAARHGIETVPATLKCIENLVSDLGPATNGARSAALRFQTELVTHVMVLSGAEGFLVGQFSRSAEDQQYRPNYIVTSNQWSYNNSNPETQVGFHPNQKPQAAGFGWMPLQDVGDEAGAVNDAQARAQAACEEIDPTLGGATNYEEGEQDYYQFKLNFYNLCDVWFGLRGAVEASGPNFSYRAIRQAWPQAVASLSSASNVTGSYQLDALGFDAIGAVRPYTYNPADGRFSYSGPPVTLN